jgi:hypothetical protein
VRRLFVFAAVTAAFVAPLARALVACSPFGAAETTGAPASDGGAVNDARAAGRDPGRTSRCDVPSSTTDFCDDFDQDAGLTRWTSQTGNVFVDPTGGLASTGALAVDLGPSGVATFVTKELPKGTHGHVEARVDFSSNDTTAETDLLRVDLTALVGAQRYSVSLVRKKDGSWVLEEYERPVVGEGVVATKPVDKPFSKWSRVELDLDLDNAKVATLKIDGEEAGRMTLVHIPVSWGGLKFFVGLPYADPLGGVYRVRLDDVFLSSLP